MLQTTTHIQRYTQTIISSRRRGLRAVRVRDGKSLLGSRAFVFLHACTTVIKYVHQHYTYETTHTVYVLTYATPRCAVRHATIYYTHACNMCSTCARASVCYLRTFILLREMFACVRLYINHKAKQALTLTLDACQAQ